MMRIVVVVFLSSKGYVPPHRTSPLRPVELSCGGLGSALIWELRDVYSEIIKNSTNALSMTGLESPEALSSFNFWATVWVWRCFYSHNVVSSKRSCTLNATLPPFPGRTKLRVEFESESCRVRDRRHCWWFALEEKKLVKTIQSNLHLWVDVVLTCSVV